MLELSSVTVSSPLDMGRRSLGVALRMFGFELVEIPGRVTGTHEYWQNFGSVVVNVAGKLFSIREFDIHGREVEFHEMIMVYGLKFVEPVHVM